MILAVLGNKSLTSEEGKFTNVDTKGGFLKINGVITGIQAN